MRVLLVSTYDLGRQPWPIAHAAPFLAGAGHELTARDLAVEPCAEADIDQADAVCVSVPMHTATRIALDFAARVRERRPSLPICLFGLYAHTVEDALATGAIDALLTGEVEDRLVTWLATLEPSRATPAGGTPGASPCTWRSVKPVAFRVPDRSMLPPPARYARLVTPAGDELLAGHTDASRGCSHRCRHCPVPAVYAGRLRRVPAGVVIADVDAQVEAGAAHISFGDPDFLNAPRHSLGILAELHRRHPGLTFDVTVKVEHILRHADLCGPIAQAGCIFAVSAFESCSDRILAILDKGHTAAGAATAVDILRRHGIALRPSWMPFTPWTALTDLADILDFVVDHDLVGAVAPVQYGIRLLVPPGSLLLDAPEMAPHIDGFDPDEGVYAWRHPDPAMDALAREVAAAAFEASTKGAPLADAFATIHRLVRTASNAAGLPGPRPLPDDFAERAAHTSVPRMTEDWFCCAEPTGPQMRTTQLTPACVAGARTCTPTTPVRPA